MSDRWLLPNAAKDAQTITAQWTPSSLRLIDGVAVQEILNVPKSNGYLTEVFRRDWIRDGTEVGQIFQVALEPGSISAWHGHANTTDRLFVSQGTVRIVLYDSRPDSPTLGVVNELCFGTIRPALVTVPPRVWHGLQNASSTLAFILNIVDRAYDYTDPDHWRVPVGSPDIPFTF